MKFANSVLLKCLGILLLTVVILESWQLLTDPVANSDIWLYQTLLIKTNCPCTLSRLPEAEEWFVTTPTIALLRDGQARSAREEKPRISIKFSKKITNFSKKNRKIAIFCVTNQLFHSL